MISLGYYIDAFLPSQTLQWHGVTNTVWWQDFPCLSSPDCLSFFTQLPEGGVDQDSRSDFSTQLVGFIASLLADVPSQAYWILELAKYDFKGAVAYLVTSIPGVYSHRSPLVSEPRYFLAVSIFCPLRMHAVIGQNVVIVHPFSSVAD